MARIQIALGIFAAVLLFFLKPAHLVISPDAIAYLRIAQYYAEGNFALAVSGYWGPLLSGLMVPLLLLGVGPMEAMKFAQAVSAIVFVSGATLLLGFMLSSLSDILLGALLSVAFAVLYAMVATTPDLLFSGLILAGTGMLLRSETPGALNSFAAGLLFGLAYLAKSIALPVAIAIIVVVLALRTWYAICKLTDQSSVRTHAGSLLRSLAGLCLVVVPWVIVLSLHYATFTWSRAAFINHAIVGPAATHHPHPFTSSFHTPDPGRVTSWEDPDPATYGDWSPVADLPSLKHQIKLIWENLKFIFRVIRTLDALGLGLAGAVLGFAFAGGRLWMQRWRLSAPLVLCFLIFYLPVHAGEFRYFLAVFPILIAAAFGLLGDLSASPEGVGIRSRLARSVIGPALVLLSFLPQLVTMSTELPRADSLGYSTAERIARALQDASAGPIVSVGAPDTVAFLAAYYAAYLSERQFRGNMIEEPSIDILTAMPRTFVVLGSGTSLEQALEHSSFAHRIVLANGGSSSEKGGVSVYLIGDSGAEDKRHGSSERR